MSNKLDSLGFDYECGIVDCPKGNGRSFKINFTKLFKNTPYFIMGQGYYMYDSNVTTTAVIYSLTNSSASFICVTANDHSPSFHWIAIKRD